MKRINKIVIGLIVFGFIQTGLIAQNLDLNQIVPLDPTVKFGKLDNGLTYYLRQNSRPEKRLELRLAINAGSICENDIQRGLAHFCEHMCFNGTKNFQKNELISVLESMGVKFGTDLNAHTSFDETVFTLQIPSDNKDLVEKGFQVLEDWAHQVTFDETEIDKERKVVLEELRSGLGANDRMQKKYFPVLLKGSLYADRLPVGTPEILKSFKYETLRDFYSEWYRPDLMAVAVVGDIPIDESERYITNHFARIKSVRNPKPRITQPIPDNVEPLISIVTDKEAASHSFQIFIKQQKAENKTVGDYRNKLLVSLYNCMMDVRLEELSRKPDAPFLFAGSGYSAFIGKTRDAYCMYASCKENQICKAMDSVLTENERVKRFGFTNSEFERQKKNLYNSYEDMSADVGKIESNDLANEYVRNFLDGESAPGYETEFEYVKAFLPAIKLEEINDLTKKWITDTNIAVVVTAPAKEGVIVPTEIEIKELLKNVRAKNISAYVDSTNDAPLLAQKVIGSKVVEKTEDQVLGLTELTFANGVKAVLKPTTFKNDEILFTAYSPGGDSIYPNSDILSANIASSIIFKSGLGEFNFSELKKKLTGTNLSIKPYISELSEGFNGKCSPKDFETLLQINYLYFTDVRTDSTVFDTWLAQARTQLKTARSNPQILFEDAFTKTVYQNNPRVVSIPSDTQIDELKLNRIMEIYKDRFADASDFTYIFVGNFTVAEVTPLLETYLGGLPSIKRKETWRDVNTRYAPGVVDFAYPKNSEQQSVVQIVLHGEFDWNTKDRVTLRMLSDIVSIKLRESMREDQGGVYDLDFSESIWKYPRQEYSITAQWGCAPENVEKLSQTFFDVLSMMKNDGPTDADIQKVREIIIRERETNTKDNGWWISALESSYYNGDKILTYDEFAALVKSIQRDDIKMLANKYFGAKEYIKAIFMPEEKEEQMLSRQN